MNFSCSIETSSNKGCGSPHLSSSFRFPQERKKKKKTIQNPGYGVNSLEKQVNLSNAAGGLS